MGKKFFAFAVTAVLFLANCCAGQISIQIVQHNLALEHVGEQSLIVEDELLNGFFNQGFIVTNSPAAVSVSDEADSDLFNAGFGAAYDGLSDYFLQVKLYYEAKGAKNPSSAKLSRIDWVLMKVLSGEKVKESSINGSDKKPGTDENVRVLSSRLIKEIRKVL